MKAATEAMLIGLWHFLESIGERPSATAIIEFARRYKHAFRDSEAKALLATLRPGPGPGQNGAHTREKPGPNWAGPGPHAGARITKELFKKDTATNTSLDLYPDSLRSSGPDALRAPGDGGDEEKKLTERENAKSKQKQADLSWVPELRAATAALAAVPLRNLTLEERLVCGRYHAFRFGNCTRSESTNRKAGAKAAAAFAKMADSRIFGSFTVRDYVDHAVVYQRDFMGGAPFYDPFLIRAVIEAQPVAVGGAR